MSELPTTGGSTALEEQTKTETEYRYDDGDDERFAHYVPKDKLMGAMLDGIPVKALCGKMWVPQRDPERFPVCPTCKEVFAKMKKLSVGSVVVRSCKKSISPNSIRDTNERLHTGLISAWSRFL